jgi:hypothetical protein
MNYKFPKLLCKVAIELLAVEAVTMPCWKNMYSFSSTLVFLKNDATVCPLHPPAFTVSEKKMGLIILNALRAHHTSTLMLCKCTLYITIEILVTSVCYFEYL